MILIEKGSAIEAIPEVDADVFENCGRCELLSKEDVVEIINRQPTIEIVRCGECKHHDGIRCFRWNSTIITGVYDFCSNGERRDENDMERV